MRRKRASSHASTTNASGDETLYSLLEQQEHALRNDEGLTLKLPRQLNLAEEILSFGITLPNRRDLHATSFPRDSVVTVVGLYTKAHLTFRSIVLLCEGGLDRPATALSRSLFETLLNIAFLTRKRVSLNYFNDSKKTPKTPVPLYGKKLTPEFRLSLFNAWNILKDNKMIENLERTPGLKRHGRKVQKTLSKIKEPYVSTIGPDWVKNIRNKNSCVGLDIIHFAASLSPTFHKWYRTIYARDSSFIHQSDIASYLEVTNEGSLSPRMFTSALEISGVLHRSALLYLCCVQEMDKRFRFGDEAEIAIQRFAQRLNDWENT